MSINGGFVPIEKIHESRTGLGTDTVRSEATTLIPDGSDNWRGSDTQQSISRQEGNNRSVDERISRADSDGKLVEVSRRITKESESLPGEKLRVVETYSVDVPGEISDGRLHLVGRTTRTERLNSTDERTIEQKMEQTNPGDPFGLRVFVLRDRKTVPDLSGEQSTETTRVRDSSGSFGVVMVEMTHSDKILTIEIEKKPSESLR